METTQNSAVTSRLWMCGAIVFCCLLSWLLYADVLHFQFVWDDSIIRARRNYANLDDIFHEAFRTPYLITSYYRPLPVLTMIFETRAGATPVEQSFYGHLINLCAFTLSLVLMLLLLFHLLHRHVKVVGWQRYLVVILAMIFAMHPAVLVGNAWISARFDVAVTMFALLLLWLDAVLVHSRWRAPLVALVFFLAALCKEMAVALAMFLPVWHLFIGWNRRENNGASWFCWIRQQGHLRVYVAVLAAGLCYLLLRYLALDHALLPEPPSRPVGTGMLARMLYVGKSLYWYAILEWWPFVRIAPSYYQSVPVSPTDIFASAGLAALILLPCMGLWLVKRGHRGGWMLLAFVVLNLPILNIKPLAIQENIADLRLAYLPATLLLLMVADGLFAVASRQSLALKAGVTTLGIWLLFAAISAVIVLPVWQNNLTFWAWYQVSSVHTASSNMSYCTALLEFKQHAEAEKCYDEFIVQYPANTMVAYYNKALIDNETGRYQQAVDDLARVLESSVQGEKADFYRRGARYLLVESLIALKKFSEARSLIEETLAHPSPEDGVLRLLNWHMLLVRCGMGSGDQAAVQRGIAGARVLAHGNQVQLRQLLQDHGLPATLLEEVVELK